MTTSRSALTLIVVPLTTSGSKVLQSMQTDYGKDKGERVFYASINKGKPGSNRWHGKPQQSRASRAPRSLSGKGR